MNEYKASDGFIPFFGVHYFEDGEMHFNMTNSGFEILADAKSVYADFSGSPPGHADSQPYIAVTVDGGETHRLPADTTAPVMLAQWDERGRHTVRVTKLTAVGSTRLALRTLRTDGCLIEHAIEKKPLSIEFIGDSLTCGMDNLATVMGSDYATVNEDGMQTFASLTAEALGADAEYFCLSGWGIYQTPYGSPLPPNYAYCDPLYCRKPRDFSLFKPDITVISLGTNDSAMEYRGVMDKIKDAYVDFMEEIRNRRGNVKFVLTLGMVGLCVWDAMSAAVAEACSRGMEAYALKLPQQVHGIGHPGVKDHEISAEILTKFIKDNLLK